MIPSIRHVSPIFTTPEIPVKEKIESSTDSETSSGFSYSQSSEESIGCSDSQSSEESIGYSDSQSSEFGFSDPRSIFAELKFNYHHTIRREERYAPCHQSSIDEAFEKLTTFTDEHYKFRDQLPKKYKCYVAPDNSWEVLATWIQDSRKNDKDFDCVIQ